MLESLLAALAELAALEARAQELVDPITSIANAVKAVVKEGALVISALSAKVASLEQQVATISVHPALSIPALEQPDAGAGAASTAAVTTEAETIGSATDTAAPSEPAPIPAVPVQTDLLAGAPDVAKVFGFDESTRAAP